MKDTPCAVLADADGDAMVTIEELYTYVRRMTKADNPEQTPALYSKDNNLILVR